MSLKEYLSIESFRYRKEFKDELRRQNIKEEYRTLINM